MKLVTWNIQWGLGCDGRIDLRRIVQTAKALCDADVFCFQEVSHGFAAHDGDQDQQAVLAFLLPGYRPVFRPAVEKVDESGRLQVFGNMILSRLPVLEIASHRLPWPATDGRSMQRQALEVLVQAPMGAMRVITTHLEYHSEIHRKAQIERLRAIHEEGERRKEIAFEDHSNGAYRTSPQPVGTILCGDLNLEPDEPLYRDILKPFLSDVPSFVDAWRVSHGPTPHPPTTGVADFKQWPQGPHCRDYIFVTENLAERVVDVNVDVETTASDHQPLALELAAAIGS
ncbi:endonuclease/exonuclease/phosphatase family protein [Microvirga sp. BT689]|uniref:endonuclease/exonuclease/phosphatase family protein n=1 Tax=Microvirga arvi TaxID=2778731 RepID=UPI001950A0C6|nr:endonuclease/exonuclease/phosphatase family protein [Microvirga arvi]MBM6582910.1 endonuclease/exonuclease/phosphatase family protein [Microvirga arvi]